MQILLMMKQYKRCHDFNLRFVTKSKAWKGVGRKCNLGVTFAFIGVWGMNPHIPKWTPILGVGIPMEFRIFKEVSQGSKFIGLKNYLYHLKALET
jgi:hypothetical protein